MSINILKSYSVSLQQLMQGNKLIVASREVEADATKFYSVSRKESLDPEMYLVGKSAFDAMLAVLDPLQSLSVLINAQSMKMSPAALRMEEIYHLVTGVSMYPGTEEHPKFIASSGLEKKIREFGTAVADIAEVKVSDGGNITTTYPIADAASVSARKVGGGLTVNSVVAGLGTVSLNDGASPIADGVSVSVAYSATKHCVMNILEPKGDVAAVFVSKGLVDYLAANS